MRLAEFILQQMEAIVCEWEAFATTLLPAAAGLDSLALRDHAQEILEAIAKDLNTIQTREEQSQKSKGLALRVVGAPETAAQTHATLRARAGFDINQLVAEYRALRASVLRLWMDSTPLDKTSGVDVTRFNEAIDEAIADSVRYFDHTVEQYRNLLLGMLGHDLRQPLTAIKMTAIQLARLNAGENVSKAAEVLIRSGASMQALLNDLTDFNRTKLGLGLSIAPAEVDLARTAQEELEQVRAAHPTRKVEFAVSGNTQGRWDDGRVRQVLRNLVSNAIKYGDAKKPVRVTLHGDQSGARFEVTNAGHVTPADAARMFEPLQRGDTETVRHGARDGLGLGLFIVREVARAHGGEVDARCEDEQTTFIVRLPRQKEVT